MSFPQISSIKTPILQELVAVGGGDHVRFLYERLIAYFPQFDGKEIAQIKENKNKHWRAAVQKAGKNLEEGNLIRRNRGFWVITEKGKINVEAESKGFTVNETNDTPLTHMDVQRMLFEIGAHLGFFAALEFEYYDVVWRETEKSQRLSHIFEVQSKGNLDSAFAKLKRAYEAQRTKPFLVVSTEKDLNRARQSLGREFNDIAHKVTVLTFAQISTVHQNLSGISEIIKELLLK